MTKNTNFVSHKKSKQKIEGKPQLPSAASLVEGEIAINFAKDVETLSIKNESGDVVTFSSDSYYSEKKLGSAFTDANSAVTVTDVIAENEEIIAAALTDLDERKLDASAYTPSGEELWESGTGESSIVQKNSSGTASGAFAVVEGLQSSGTGMVSHAEGGRTIASGGASHAEGDETFADGNYSHAEGYKTSGTGQASHAEGAGSIASGNGSHAEGSSTKADGNYSHAEGSGTKALEDYSHTEGIGTSANSTSSHAEGSFTSASGTSSHAEGNGTITSNDYEHASGTYNISNNATTEFGDSGNTLFSVGNGTDFDARHNAFEIRQNGDIYIASGNTDIKLQDYLGGGGSITVDQTIDSGTSASTNAVSTSAVYGFVTSYTPSGDSLWEAGTGLNSVVLKGSSGTATGDYSVAEGYNTVANGNYSHAEGSNTIASGPLSHAEGSSTSATSTGSHAEGSSTTASGVMSHAEGIGTTASGSSSHAEGYGTTSSSDSSHAEGYGTKAGGYSSHAEGYQTSATSTSSHAEGYGTTSSGYSSHAEGQGTLASGSQSHAEGKSTSATSDSSHAEGLRTLASGSQSHAEGQDTLASGYYSHAEGHSTSATSTDSHAEGGGTTASGGQSHAEGQDTLASGYYSHAEGHSTSATSNSSHAEGLRTLASGSQSHAEGQDTLASGDYSHAEGNRTTANNQSEHASGQFNVSSSASATFGDSGNTLFSVGNGTAGNTRHNAFEIRQNGDIYITSGNTDIKLQDHLGGGGGSITVDQVLDNTTSASTNPVSSKAVYDAVTDNELVWTNAYVTLSGTVSAHTANTEIHVTAADKEKLHTHSNKNALDSITGNVGTMAYQNTNSYSSATQVSTALQGKSNSNHNQGANTITAMTGYQTASTVSAISTSDTLNKAMAKLEARFDGIRLLKITQTDYDNLQTKDPNTLYVITD